MKKIIALLIVAVMCLSFVACGNNADKENTGNNAETNNTQVSDKKAEAEKAIVGIWVSADSGDSLTFEEDKNGKFTDERYFRWKYDEELNCYLLALYGWGTYPLTIKNDDGVDYIRFDGKGDIFYRQENSK